MRLLFAHIPLSPNWFSTPVPAAPRVQAVDSRKLRFYRTTNYLKYFRIPIFVVSFRLAHSDVRRDGFLPMMILSLSILPQ
jgi:hypothetical protein